jgi:hypothetical protein
MAGNLSIVIPEPAAGRNPESIATDRDHGFRVRALARAPRNDD